MLGDDSVDDGRLVLDVRRQLEIAPVRQQERDTRFEAIEAALAIENLLRYAP